MPEGADVITRVGWDNTSAVAGAREAEQIYKGHKERADRILSGIGEGIGLGGGFAGLQGFQKLIEGTAESLKRGLDFNAEMNNAEVGIGNILQRFEYLNAAAAKQEAGKALQQIRELEPVTAGGLKDLAGGFLATAATALSAGLSVQQNITLVSKFANALANAGIPLEQLGQEMRSVFAGDITHNSAIAKILGITNDDVKNAKATGNLFDFLNAKLGAFGEAGDSAAVRFSSLSSAIDQALGTLSKPLFDQVLAGSLRFAKQLQDPEFLTALTRRGEDIAHLAEQALALGEKLLRAAPSFIAIASSAAQAIPTMVSLSAAWLGLKMIGGITSLITQQKTAVDASAKGFQDEYAALKQNTAAQKENAAARQSVSSARFQPILRDSKEGKKLGSNLIAENQHQAELARVARQNAALELEWSRMTAAAAPAGARVNKSFVDGFVKGPLTNLNGMTPLFIGAVSSALLDPSKAIGGTVGKSITDGLSLFLASMGPYGMLASVAAQLIQGAHMLGEQMGDALAASLHGRALASAGEGIESTRDLVAAGKIEAGRADLNATIANLKERIAAASHEEAVILRSQLALAENLSEHFYSWAERVYKAAQAGQSNAAALTAQVNEAAALKARQEEILEAQKKVKEKQDASRARLPGMQDKVEEDIIKLTPPDAQIRFWKERLDREMRGIKIEFAPIFNGGKITEFARSLEGLLKLADQMREKGDFLHAEQILKAATAVQEATNKMKELAKARDEAQKNANDKADKIRIANEELVAEMRIAKLRAESHGEQTKALKAAEDALAVDRLKLQLMEQMHLEADAALKLAQAKVQAERAATEAAEQYRQATAKQDIMGEVRLLALKAGGHFHAAQALERELRIAADAKRIREQTGVSEARSLEIARYKADLEDKANRRANGGFSSTIKGYTGATTTGPNASGLSGLDWLYANGPSARNNRQLLDPLSGVHSKSQQNQNDARDRQHAGHQNRVETLLEGVNTRLELLLG